MRIIQIGQFPLHPDLIRGGVESSVYGLASELSKSHSVIVFDYPRFDSTDSIEKIGDLTVYRFRNRGQHLKDASERIPEMISILISLKPTICHIHGTSPFNWKIFKALRNNGIHVAVTVHGLAKVEKKKSLMKHFSFKTLYQLIVQSSAEKNILNAAKRVIVDTVYVENAIRRYHLSAIPQMVVIPQGIHEQYFDISCSNHSREILSVGAISKRKGHLLLIQSFENLCERIPDVHLTICGSKADSGYYTKIQEHISSSPYRDKVSLYSDVPKDELLKKYQEAHLFALHSQEESQGIALVEAMATGLPVVSTKVGGIPFVVSQGTTGLLSEYGDIVSFSAALEHLLTSQCEWLLMSRECRQAAKSYSWKTVSEEVLKVYHSILSDL